MGSWKMCMNEACCLTTSSEWKQGWELQFGGFALLCSNCGTAYENSVFCEKFHKGEDGWRECGICRKLIHCGCVASKLSHEYLDFGGVGCKTCVNLMDTPSVRPVQIIGVGTPNGTLTRDVHPTIGNGIGHRNSDALLKICKNVDVNGAKKAFKSPKCGTSVSPGQQKGEGSKIPFKEVNKCSPNFNPNSVESSMFVKPDVSRQSQGFKDKGKSLGQPSKNFMLGNASSASGSVFPSSNAIVEGGEQNKVSPSLQGQRGSQVLPEPRKPASRAGSYQAAKGMKSQILPPARPPADARGRTQLHARYWPRITDEELQQISRDLRSTILPLFEKILSASDAGRVGRMVVPKACAETYFPRVYHSEGLPLRIQDVMGNEWRFQFRFWPNNNSRMYVLEGVHECLQNMQLRAGDTLTFSRTFPGGQLVIGFRRTNLYMDLEPFSIYDGGFFGETSYSGAIDDMPPSEIQTIEDSSQQHILIPEENRARNIGSKNKRLHMQCGDAFELKVTWEEAQELLSPPNSTPTVIKIKECVFEEYNEPPIIGKRTVFTLHTSGRLEQWAQCDSCSKWRRLPSYMRVPARWTCSDNTWDSNRNSCSAPDEINPMNLEALNIASNEFKRMKFTEEKVAEDGEPSGLDTLAAVAVLEENIGELTEISVGAAAKLPRRRGGCSCIVCIQPPSGKGKHPVSCKCSVCSTVKCRFKARKKMRKSDRDAGPSRGNSQETPIDISDTEGLAEHALVLTPNSDVERNQNGKLMNVVRKKRNLDLNRYPCREEDMVDEAAAGLKIASLMDAASIPLDM